MHFNVYAQSEVTTLNTDPAAAPSTEETYVTYDVPENREKQMTNSLGEPNRKRIRRFLSIVSGVKTDEEFLIPSVPLRIAGPAADLIEIQRIKNTDVFRIMGTSVGAGIVTIHNQRTGQIYVELHVDVRDSSMDKMIRELKSLLADVEGVEYKVANGGIILDGYVLLPQDLIRVSNVIAQVQKLQENIKISSLVELSPVARKKIIEYISREINNPEVVISAVGDFVKLEGSVNSPEEHSRIIKIVSLYLPTYVVTKSADPGTIPNVHLAQREIKGGAEEFIVDMITIRRQEEQDPPPKKMVQVVAHFVEFSESYNKFFQFLFSPSISTLSSSGQVASAPAGTPPTTAVVTESNSIDSIANLVSNLMPKLQWGRTYGYLRVLDTASVLVQESQPANLNRTLTSMVNGSPQDMTLSLSVTPTISQPRSGLVDLQLTVVNTPNTGGSVGARTEINTLISVRDRQSAAFGGVINKAMSNDYGVPENQTSQANFTMNARKKNARHTGNSVVFVTPIIKTSASAGVDQVKKKFRLKE